MKTTTRRDVTAAKMTTGEFLAQLPETGGMLVPVGSSTARHGRELEAKGLCWVYFDAVPLRGSTRFVRISRRRVFPSDLEVRRLYRRAIKRRPR